MSKQKNPEKTVAWFIVKKSLIKFVEDEDSVQVADNVMEVSDFDKYPILKGDTVEVGEKDDEVIFLRKVKGASKKSFKKTESTSDAEVDESITKEVYCVSQYGLKFVGDKQWTNFSDDLQKQDLKSLGIIAKNTITVNLSEGKIVSVAKVEEKKEEKPETSTKKSGGWRDEDSTDRRTASMNAKDVVVALINNQLIEKAKIKLSVTDLAETFYNVMKNL